MSKKKSTKKTTETTESHFINPIDKSKIAENPGLLPYAHTAGGAIIKPEDKGRIKGNAMTAMYDQTDRQMDQLRQQMETLVAQAEKLKNRVEVSEMIYQADTGFVPVVHQIYYLYQRDNGRSLMSLVSPEEWGRKKPFEYVASIRLLGDHTWEVLHEAGQAA
jgi:Protein of unknown function (DUF2452)